MSGAPHELTDDQHPHVPGLYRLRAGRDIPRHGVRAGDLGGWVHSATQVSDEAWVSDAARVYDAANVSDEACVSGTARVYDAANVFGNARVSGEAQVSGNAQVYGVARVYDEAQVSGNAQVYGAARVSRDARVSERHHVLAVAGLPSGPATLHPVVGGHLLRVGCWTGTVSELRAIAQGDAGWPDARGAQIPLRRPGLLALADLCEAHMTAHGWGLGDPS